MPNTDSIYTAAVALHQAVLRYGRSCVELRRATNAGTQPRMQKAGNRHYFAELRMFNAAKDFAMARRNPMRDFWLTKRYNVVDMLIIMVCGSLVGNVLSWIFG